MAALSIEKENSIEEMKEEIIDDISCPITRQIMIEPVVLSDGHTYEKEAIKIWLREHITSPKTNKPLILGKHFSTNFALKKTINTIMKLNILSKDVIATYKERLDRYNLNIDKAIFKLVIKTLSGRNYQLDVTVDTTISDIFDEQILDLPKDQVMLIYERKYLPSYLLKYNPETERHEPRDNPEDLNRPLSDFGINKDTELYMRYALGPVGNRFEYVESQWKSVSNTN
mgnify:FL=1|tara:strand:- start:350 stop:1033 length:684 start_codon:yes stop_codon:yes gene_type:complete